MKVGESEMIITVCNPCVSDAESSITRLPN